MPRPIGRHAIALLTLGTIAAGCVARPPGPSSGPTRTTPASVPAPSRTPDDLPAPNLASDWHAVAVLAADRTAFQAASADQGSLAGGRTVWAITAAGAFVPADPIEPAVRFGVIQGPTGFVDWDTPGIVRWSPDGLTWWDDPAGPLDANLSTIVPAGGRLLLVGQSTGARTGAWLSDGGRSWTEALGAPLDLWSAVEWPGHGIVAAGGSGPSTAVWSSPDGSAWQAAGAPRPLAGTPDILDLAASPGRVVAIGAVDGRPAAWWTADLRTWAEAGSAWGGDALLESITRIDDTFFIAGRRSLRPVLWASSDGIAWSGVDLPFEDGLEGEASLVTETHLQPIVFGFTTRDEGNGGWSRIADRVWVLGRWPSG